jgi:hypothetical protein
VVATGGMVVRSGTVGGVVGHGRAFIVAVYLVAAQSCVEPIFDGDS